MWRTSSCDAFQIAINRAIRATYEYPRYADSAKDAIKPTGMTVLARSANRSHDCGRVAIPSEIIPTPPAANEWVPARGYAGDDSEVEAACR